MKTEKNFIRASLAYGIVIISIIAITLLAYYVIRYDHAASGKDVFNIILPVFATWVGTIIAFYFGRENFESANKQLKEMVQTMTPEERRKVPIKEVMRNIGQVSYYVITENINDDKITLSDLNNHTNEIITRLPLIQKPAGTIRYMIHDSRLGDYLKEKEEHKLSDSLEQLITYYASKDNAIEFSENKGFIIVSEDTHLGKVKTRMEALKSCQDIFITKNGTSKEAVIGWVSNIRLMEYLRA